MTKHVLFVQGGGEDVHDEWDNKLVASLERKLGPEYEIRYPPMPNEADPNYALWKAALKKEFARLDNGAILVGHSIGATILINVLAEEPSESAPSGIFLIAAPFVGKGGWPSEDIKPLSDLGLAMSIFTRKQFRKLSSAGSPVATISSMRTCRKSPPTSDSSE